MNQKKKKSLHKQNESLFQMEYSEGIFPLLLETCSEEGKKKKTKNIFTSLSPITSCIYFKHILRCIYKAITSESNLLTKISDHFGKFFI